MPAHPQDGGHTGTDVRVRRSLPLAGALFIGELPAGRSTGLVLRSRGLERAIIRRNTRQISITRPGNRLVVHAHLAAVVDIEERAQQLLASCQGVFVPVVTVVEMSPGDDVLGDWEVSDVYALYDDSGPRAHVFSAEDVASSFCEVEVNGVVRTWAEGPSLLSDLSRQQWDEAALELGQPGLLISSGTPAMTLEGGDDVTVTFTGPRFEQLHCRVEA